VRPRSAFHGDSLLGARPGARQNRYPFANSDITISPSICRSLDGTALKSCRARRIRELKSAIRTAQSRHRLLAFHTAPDRSDFERVREEIILTIRRSKTDQDAVGREIGIPFGRTVHCRVRALENWLSGARIEGGPVFLPVEYALIQTVDKAVVCYPASDDQERSNSR
jgi:hypothetical protein